MKIIGAELRVTPAGYRPIEAKIIPFELAIPEIFTDVAYRSVGIELTIHTSAGDVTATLQLPEDQARNGYRTVNEEEFLDAYKLLRQRVEAMS